MKPVITQVPLPVLPDEILSKIGDAWVDNRNNEALKTLKSGSYLNARQWAMSEALKDTKEMNMATSYRVASDLKRSLYDSKNFYKGNLPFPRPITKKVRGKKITIKKTKKSLW